MFSGHTLVYNPAQLRARISIRFQKVELPRYCFQLCGHSRPSTRKLSKSRKNPNSWSYAHQNGSLLAQSVLHPSV